LLRPELTGAQGPRPDDDPAELAARDDAEAPAFTPTSHMLAYLWALCGAIADGKPFTNTDICAAAGISRTTLWNWKQRIPGFADWVAKAIRTNASGAIDWELMIARFYQEAKAGSVEHARFLLELRKLEVGAARGQEQPLAVDQGPQIVFNLPRAPSDYEGRTVVRGAVEVIQS
jgi:hypothetical protein